MANEVTKLNGIAIGSITNVNGITDSNLSKLNGQEFTGAFTASYSLNEIGSETSAARVFDDERGFGTFTTYDPSTDQHIVAWGDDGNSDYGTIRCMIWNGTTVYQGSDYVFHSGGVTIFNMVLYDASKTRCVLGFEAWTGSYYQPWIGSVNVGAKQSSTNPYDFSSGDFTETDSSDSTIINVKVADGTSGNIRQVCSSFMSYNEAYDVYMWTMNQDGDNKKYVKAFYLNSNGSLTAGTAVEFDDYDDRMSFPVYDGNIERTVLMYNDSSSSGKIRVVKHTGTSSISDRVALSLDSEISHYRLPTNVEGGFEGVMAQYYPESTCIFHQQGSNDTTAIRYFKLTGNDSSGYSKVSGSGYNDDVQNLWYYMQAPGDNQSDHGGASIHYVKGRGRMVVLFVDNDDAAISGSYDARAKGVILEWNATRAAADAQQRAEDIQLGYTGSLEGGVIVLSHTYRPPGYGAAYNGTKWLTMGAYGETNINERPEGLMGMITMDGGFNDQWMLKPLEPGTTGSP